MKNKHILRIIQQVNNFKDLERKIFKVVCQQAQDALKDVLILIDDKLMEHRDKELLDNRGIRKREIKTLFGMIESKRKYYKDTNGTYHYLLDKYLVVDKRDFGGVFTSDVFWQEATTHLYENYLFNSESITLLNGDAAPWIAKGRELLPNITAWSLDNFHWNRKIRKLLGRSDFVPKVYQAIRDDDKEVLVEVLNKAKSYRQKKEDKKKVDELKNYLLSYWQNIKPFEDRGIDLPDEMRGMGAIESNVDKILVVRVKSEGMSWTIEGLKNLAAIIIADRNNELEFKINKRDWEFKELPEIKEGNRSLQTKPSRDESEVLKAGMPALEGPMSGKDWTEILRILSSWETNNPAVL